MRFNLVCLVVGHKSHRDVERDEIRKDGKWTLTTRIELVGCERCGEPNPNHRAYDLLPASGDAANAAIARAMGAAAQQEPKP